MCLTIVRKLIQPVFPIKQPLLFSIFDIESLGMIDFSNVFTEFVWHLGDKRLKTADKVCNKLPQNEKTDSLLCPAYLIKGLAVNHYISLHSVAINN